MEYLIVEVDFDNCKNEIRKLGYIVFQGTDIEDVTNMNVVYMTYSEFENEILKGEDTYYWAEYHRIDSKSRGDDIGRIFVDLRNRMEDIVEAYKAIKMDKHNYKVLIERKKGMLI